MPTNNSRVGDLLRNLRQQRGLSRNQLAEHAQVGSRTLRYWEAGECSPRMVELESVLHVLQATEPERTQILALLTTPRALRRAHSQGLGETNLLSDPIPDLGDLMQAMRLRRGWSRERLADALGIHRMTVYRWETMQSFPTEESLMRLCRRLNAHPDEWTALNSRRLSPRRWPSILSLEACWRQCEHLYDLVLNGWSPLMELSLLAVRRQLMLLAPTASQARSLLAQLDHYYGIWLLYQERYQEAQAILRGALHIATAPQTPYDVTPGLLNLQSHLIWKGPGGAQAAVAMLQDAACGIPEKLRCTLYCDMAFYTATLQQPDGVAAWLDRARQTFERACDQQAEQNTYYRTTYARSLIELGRPLEGMRWLQQIPSDPRGLSTITTLQNWSQALLASGDKAAAVQHLERMGELLTTHEIPLRRRQWEALTRKL